VRAALDEPLSPEVSTEAVDAAPAPIADFERHYQEGLLRRLRGGAGGHRPNFERGALLSALARHRLPEGLAHALTESAAKAQLTDMTLALASALDKRIKTYPIDVTTAGALLLVGPNGAGKTAVAAKIAAHARLAGRRTTLVAADSAGAGAVERLETFAKHLDCAIATADSAVQLNGLVSDCVAKKTFVIVDTAGFDPRDAKARTAFQALAAIGKLEALGVVSALNDAEELTEIASELANLGARRLIVTGLDLARRAGALIAAATAPIPLAHVTRSPFVAGGLEEPSSLTLARLLLDESRSTQ